MAISESTGCFASIGTTQTATAGDTYVEIGEVTNIGEFGPSFAIVSHKPLKTGLTKKFKGSRDDGTLTVQLAEDLADAGQDAVRTALAARDAYNFQITLATGFKYQFKALVTGNPTTIGEADGIVGASIQLAIITGSRSEVAPA